MQANKSTMNSTLERSNAFQVKDNQLSLQIPNSVISEIKSEVNHNV